MPLGVGSDKAVVELPLGQAGASVDHSETAPRTGWWRVWRVGRVLLILAAVVVLGANLVRFMSKHETKAETPGAERTKP